MYLVGKQKYFIETVLDMSRKATVSQVGETVVSRFFMGCLVQACAGVCVCCWQKS